MSALASSLRPRRSSTRLGGSWTSRSSFGMAPGTRFATPCLKASANSVGRNCTNLAEQISDGGIGITTDSLSPPCNHSGRHRFSGSIGSASSTATSARLWITA